MSTLLLGLFLFLNISVFFIYYQRSNGIFQIPCLFSIVSLTFVSPQLFDIMCLVNNPDEYMGMGLYVMLSCSFAIILGFERGRCCPVNKIRKKTFVRSRLWYVIAVFAVIGISATLLNRGVYKGGFVSGTYVVINFFTSYLDYLLIIILIVRYKNIHLPWIVYVILVVVIFLQIDKFLITARRGEAIQFVLTLAFFFFFTRPEKTYQRLRWVIPFFFIVGMLLTSQISSYRNKAYSGKVSVIENIKGLDVPFVSERTSLKNAEMNNAILGINTCYQNGVYDYGIVNWNGLIKNFVPSSLGGLQFKKSLMCHEENKTLVTYLSRSGSTMTGYYDAFTSFGLFAWVKFFMIGLVFGLLWRQLSFSVVALVLYVGTLSSALHSITHSTNNVTSDLFFFIVFIYPFIKFCTVSSLGEDQQES